MRHSKGKYKDALRGNFYFRDLEIDEIDRVLEKYKWSIKLYDKKEIEFDEEAILKNLNIIIDGEIKIAKATETGKEILYDILGKGDCFGLTSLYTDTQIEGIQYEALGRSHIFYIEELEFKKLIFDNPYFFRKFMEFQEYRLYFFMSRFENSFIPCPYEKLIYYFTFLKKWNIYEVGMQKIQLANYLNIGRASLYRELDKMKAEKLISIVNNKIHIK